MSFFAQIHQRLLRYKDRNQKSLFSLDRFVTNWKLAKETMLLSLGNTLSVLSFGALVGTSLCVWDVSVYKRLTDLNKWNSVPWRYLKQVPENSALRCGKQCLRMGGDCQAFAINSHKYGYCVLLGGFLQLNGLVWMNRDGGWTVYHVLSCKCQHGRYAKLN